MSYLLFDSAYAQALIDIGYRDAGARIDEIETFLLGDGAARNGSSNVRLMKGRKRAGVEG
jgi:hypothetical protein